MSKSKRVKILMIVIAKREIVNYTRCFMDNNLENEDLKWYENRQLSLNLPSEKERKALYEYNMDSDAYSDCADVPFGNGTQWRCI